MLKVAMLSYWHVHAWDYTNNIKARSDCQIVAVWDELPDRGRDAAGKLGVPFYDSLEELLANPEVEAVVVDAPSNMHEEVMVAAARAGKHIFTEKVLTLTTAEADRVIEAVEASGKTFMISLPRLTDACNLYIKQAIESGLVGDVTLVRTRLAHDGALPQSWNANGWLPEHFYDKEKCGGGALIDLGCHPMYLAWYFLGLPESVSAQYGYVTGRAVEDNAVATLKYANGALAVVEAGFAARFSPFTVEVYGTHGCILFDDKQMRIRSTKLELGMSDGWVTVDYYPAPPARPIDQWVDRILYGKETTITIGMGRALTQLMEGANRSATEGVTVKL